MNGDNPWWANAWLVFAAFCGSVTSLSLMPWKTMEKREIALTLFVGCTFSLFVGPFAARQIFHIEGNNLEIFSAVMFFGATGANAFIPFLIRKFTNGGGAA